MSGDHRSPASRTAWASVLVCAATLGAFGCGGASVPAHPSAPLFEKVAQGFEGKLAASRTVFLGGRKTAGMSCVEKVDVGSLVDRGNVPVRLKGEGAGCATFLRIPRGNTPVEDFQMLQARFRPWLEARLRVCRAASAPMFELADETARIGHEIASWDAIPEGLPRIDVVDPEGSRPAYCLSAMSQALRSRDIVAAKEWSTELASACFHVADLHRWLELLYTNLLTALDFQRECRDLFAATTRLYAKQGYDRASSLSRFPAGSLVLYGERNFYEVERQAENLFALSKDRPVSREARADVPAAYFMPPELRSSFVRLRASLSAANQRTWDAAAGAPYNRSYIENMLFRIGACGVLDAAGAALRRLDARRPRASSAELLDVIFYRAGGFFCGLEWADRFDQRLLAAAKNLRGDNMSLLTQAYALTNARFDTKAYQGGTLTLRSALDTGSFDCIRATDMIGAIYRNAGGTRFFDVRICRGGPSHTVAGIEVDATGGDKVFSVDGLLPKHQGARTWPDSWFRASRDYCVETYYRGLDTSIWAGGYIVFGPAAGTRMDAAIPYLPGRETRKAEKVFHGPYPRRFVGAASTR